MLVAFFRQVSGNEPVRDWLKDLEKEERKTIGEDIKTVQFGWPVGLPWSKPLGGGLHEVLTDLENRIARVFFCFHDDRMVLLHGIIKKSQKTPKSDLALARKRMKIVKDSNG